MNAGPFSTETEAMAGVRARATALGGDTIAGARAVFADALDGIDLGAYDRRIVDWLTNLDQPTLAVLAGIIDRARDASRRRTA